MESKNIAFKTILIFGIVAIFSSCNGRIKTETKQPTLEQKPIGNIVRKLDPKATLTYQDQKGNYWFQSKNKGVYQYDGKILVLFTSDDGLISNRIIEIQEDKIGNIYFDTTEGISKFDGQNFTTLEVIENDSSRNEWKLERDDLWFRMGWDKKGPYRFDGKKLYYLEFPKNKMEDEFLAKYPNVSHSLYGIYKIYKDSKGDMWFGTADMGIYRYDGQKISWMYEQQLTETPGGGAFGIRSIVEAEDGYFWICNAAYKYKILPDNLENNGLDLINYKREIGTKNKGKETLYFLSMVIDDSGDVWMVTYDNGVWRYNGKELIQYPIKDGEKNILLFSIYKDNQDHLWIGTHNNGTYKYNGKSFDKFRIN